MTRQDYRNKYQELRRECVEYCYAVMNKNTASAQDFMSRFRVLATPEMVLSLIDDLMEMEAYKVVVKPKTRYSPPKTRGPQ